RRHTRFSRDWSSDVCSSDLLAGVGGPTRQAIAYALGAQPLGFLGIGDRLTGRAADTGKNRHLPCAGIDSRPDDFGVFLRSQREELAGATRSEQRLGPVWRQPFEALDIAAATEVALLVEIGDRKGQ